MEIKPGQAVEYWEKTWQVVEVVEMVCLKAGATTMWVRKDSLTGGR